MAEAKTESRKRRDLITEASCARADLNMFYAIIALCESSLFSTPSYAAETRIVKICRSEADKCLRRYDRACAKLGAPYADVQP